MGHKLRIKGQMFHQILHRRSGNEEHRDPLLFDHTVSKPTLKYGSQTWIFNALDGETFTGSANGISETSRLQ